MKQNIRLSIVVPCYRVERYLHRCLDCLLNQTMGNIELVCVNDGSPDGCLEILREYEAKHAGRILVIDQENAGLGMARKAGIEASSGEYIGFADPDDTVMPDFAEKLYSAAKTEDADIACCGFDRVNEETGKLYSREMMKFPYDSFDFGQDPGLMVEVNIAVWNKIFRADILRDAVRGQRFPRIFEDVILEPLIWLNTRKVVFVKESLIRYMVRKDSLIETVKADQFPEIYRMMKEIRGFYRLRQPELLPFLDAVAFLHLGVSMMHRTAGGGRQVLREALRENRQVLDQSFPLWRRNPYLCLSYVFRHRSANLKTTVVHRIFRMGLSTPFLRVYTGLISYFGINIKW